MKLLRILLVLVLVMALIFTVAALPTEQDQEQEDTDYDLSEQSYDEANEFSSEHRFGRILAQKKLRKARRVRCNKFPRICHAKGSPGPYCCKKKCVNVLTDRLNCGACGKKCKYNQMCCNGKCINPFFNRRHCGGCNNRCNSGEFCAFGLCNYA
ncbi:stigma-specific STIG1-like protein 1 [Ricinus communis]|uniref:Stigma-specific Stig1 family protein n=1 Tax=Ricinus communis TaxID=3988 RepID=B9STX9_RICCO|nr:stigma-specific STIG1-like protein 1 [Ricinus communis]EEF32914.1 conserved hypothetical protein [Ricinus communis]|eukprot:XP_002529448.1 stigma-specific STIG1-like protein 1 [Ricinus communis]